MNVQTSPHVTLLNGFAVRLGGTEPCSHLAHLPHAVQRLVAHLCLTRTPVRNAIAGNLWPDVPEAQAHGSLRSALWRLHKVAPGLVDTSDSGLCLAGDVRVDVRELSDWARRTMVAGSRVEDVPVPEAALAGDLLPGWYDDWVLLERERLRQLRLHALELVAIRLADTGRNGEALQAALAAVRAEPLRESAQRTLVRVHIAGGNVVEALQAYEAFRALLERDLGVLPTEIMTALVRGLVPVSVSRV
jgi:DNA-binding SARP family transcriptional activator